MKLRFVLAALAVVLTTTLAPVAGWSFGQPPPFNGGNPGNGGGAQGAPLPLLGASILGQGAAVAGGYLIWRRRRKRKAQD